MADRLLQRPGFSTSGQLPRWFGVPFLLGGLVVLAIGVVLLMDELRLSNEGATTTAVVVEKNYSPGGDDSGPTYELGYEFDAIGTSRSQRGSSDVSEEMYDATSLGATVQVTYLPSDPTKSRIGSTDAQLFVPLMVMGGGVIFLVVGGAMLVIVPRLRRRVAAAVALGATYQGAAYQGAAYQAQPDPEAEPLADADPLAYLAHDEAAPPAEHRPTTEAELRALDARLAAPPKTDTAE